MPEALPTIKQALAAAHEKLQGDTARLDADVLLSHVLGKPRTHLIAWPDKLLTADELHKFDNLVDQRAAGTPVAYIVEAREFWSLSFRVTPDVLIPRPDTELLVETALELLPQTPCDVVDLGTGSGAIAISLAHERPQWRISASDASDSALEIATLNSTLLKTQVTFFSGEWFEPFSGQQFDLIVSNPPYICEADPHLQQGDVRFEPGSALHSGADGLDDIRLIVRDAPSYLKSQGWLLLEHGYNQAQEVRKIMLKENFSQVRSLTDLAGIERVTMGQKTGERA